MRKFLLFIILFLVGFEEEALYGQCVAPVGVSTSNATFNTVGVSWTAVGGANSYQISYRAVGAQNWSTQGTGNVTTATVYGLQAGTTYEVRVRANCTGFGYGSFSEVVQFSTLSCQPPVNVWVSDISLTTAKVNWSLVSGAVSYEINFRAIGTQNWSSMGAGNVNNATIYGLTANTNYEVRVKANCGAGGWSGFGSPSVQFSSLTCLAPATVSVGTITNTTAVVNWSASAYAVSYQLRYRAVGTQNWSVQGAGNVTTATIYGLSAGKDYEVEVRANCAAGGWSDYGDSAEFTTGGCTAPTTLTVDTITLTGATVQWTAVAGVSGYTLTYRIQGTQSWTTLNTATNTYTLTNLTPATTYEIRVRSRCGTLLSQWTDIVGFVLLTSKIYQEPSLEFINQSYSKVSTQDCFSAFSICSIGQNYNNSTSVYGPGLISEIPIGTTCIGAEINSVWFTADIASNGTFGFTINPSGTNQQTDYDFAVFDITGTNCTAIASGLPPIRCNYSGFTGPTGLSCENTALENPPISVNGTGPLIIPGIQIINAPRRYAIVVNNYSQNTTGFTLASCGTVQLNTSPSVTNTLLNYSGCPGTTASLTFTLNTSVVCDGSTNLTDIVGGDFIIATVPGQAVIPITNLTTNCNGGATNTFSISFVPPSAGIYSICINNNSIANNCGIPIPEYCETITISPYTLTASGNNLCPGGTLNLSAGVENLMDNEAVTYTWDGPGASDVQGQNPTIFSAQAGTYTVTATISNSNNVIICTLTQTVEISTLTAPPVNVTATPNPVCAGSGVTITATALNCASCQYQWNYLDGTVPTTVQGSNTLIHFPQQTTTYTITVTDNNGCTGTNTVTVIVNPNPTVVINSSSITPCPGQMVTISAQPGASGAFTYQWNFGTATLIGGNGAGPYTVTWGTAGTYPVSVTITDANGCMNTAITTITVASPQVVAASNSPVCTGQTLNLTANAPNCQGCTFQWTGPGGFNSTLQNPQIATITPFAAGIYTVTVTDMNGCSAQATVNVVVNPNPRVSLAVNPNPICAGQPVTFTTTVTPENFNYDYLLFSPAGTLIGQQQNNPVFTFPQGNNLETGNYTVLVQDLGTNCFATAQVNLVVNPVPQFTIGATPNPVCIGQTLSLTSTTPDNCLGDCTFSWMGPGGFIDNTPNTTVFVPNNQTSPVYHLTVTNGAGCTATQSVNVAIAQPQPITVVQPLQVCPGQPVTVTAPPGLLNYQWILTPDVPFTVNAHTVTFNAIAGLQIAVQANEADGCIRTGQTTLHIQNCCPALNNLTGVTFVNNTDAITEFGAGAQTLTGQTFVFLNDFTINTDITFDNCTLYFQPDRRLTVNDGFTFTANTATLTACDCLWGGIVAQENDNATPFATVNLNNSTVSRAVRGLVGLNGAQVSVTNGSTFTENHTHIALLAYRNAPASNFTLNSSTLQNVIPLPCNDLTTSLSEFTPYTIRSLTGLHALDVYNLQVNSAEFRNLQHGILVLNFDPTVQVPAFGGQPIQHIITANTFTNEPDYCLANGINQISSQAIDVSNAAIPSNTSFAFSISLEHTLTIGNSTIPNSGNYIKGFGTGIVIDTYRTIDVHHNSLEQVGKGIFIRRLRTNANVDPNSTVHVANLTNNTIGFQEYGIRLTTKGFTNSVSANERQSDVNILNNTLTRETDNSNVSDIPATAYGIKTDFRNELDLNIQHNQITFNDNTRNNIGVFIQHAAVIKEISSNTIQFTPNAVYSSGVEIIYPMNQATGMAVRNIKSNDIGLLPGAPAHIGISILNESVSVNAQGVNNSLQIDQNTIDIIGDSDSQPVVRAGISVAAKAVLFQVRKNTIRCVANTNVPNTHGIHSSASGISFDSRIQCNEITDCQNGITIDGQGMNLNTQILNNTLNHNTYGIRLQNGALLQDQGSNTQPSDNQWLNIPNGGLPTAVQDVSEDVPTIFFVRAGQEFNPNPFSDQIGPGALCQADLVANPSNPPLICDNLNTGLGIPPVNPTDPAIRLALRRIAYDSLAFTSNIPQSRYLAKRNLYAWLKNYPAFFAQDAKFIQQYDSISTTNIVLFAQVDTLINQNDLLAAQTLNGSISPTAGDIESNQKLVNDILLYYLIAQQTGQYPNGQPVLPTDPPFTLLQYSRITGLAAQCPHIGGTAVYTARALKAFADGRPTQYADNCTPYFPPYRVADKTQSLAETKNRFALYPNPSRERFTVEAVLLDAETATMTVFDAKGIKIGNYPLQNGTQNIETHKWGAGIYYCKIIDAKAAIHTTKIVVLK